MKKQQNIATDCLGQSLLLFRDNPVFVRTALCTLTPTGYTSSTKENMPRALLWHRSPIIKLCYSLKEGGCLQAACWELAVACVNTRAIPENCSGTCYCHKPEMCHEMFHS